MKPKRHRIKHLKHLVSNHAFDYFISKRGYISRFNRGNGTRIDYYGNVQPSSGYTHLTILGKAYLLHRLVAITYIPNPDDLATVDHIDGDKTNNHMNNLRWMSQGDNTRATPKTLHSSSPCTKAITINSKEFNSIRSGATYIFNNSERGSLDTIRKELRKFKQGRRPSWKMYNEFLIED